MGEAGLYAATTVVFLGLSGLLLYPLVLGPSRVWRLFRCFLPAFLAYAVAWCMLWFALGPGLGEWLGSLAGSLALVWLIGLGLDCRGGLVRSWAVFFFAHSAGYFAGGWSMAWILQASESGMFGSLSSGRVGILAKLSWGLAYGAGFGAGLGYVFHACQRHGEDDGIKAPGHSHTKAEG